MRLRSSEACASVGCVSASSVPSMRSTVKLVMSSDQIAPRANNKTRAARPGLRSAGWSSVSVVGSSDSFRTAGTRELFLMLPVGPRHLTTHASAPTIARHALDERNPCPVFLSLMPELPDLAILADALDEALVGRRHDGRQGAADAGAARHACGARGLRWADCCSTVRRRGKFLVFAFDRDRIVFNPMLTGRLGLAVAGAKAWPQWAAPSISRLSTSARETIY